MSLSPTSSTVQGAGESSPSSTAQARTSPLPSLDTSASEGNNSMSPNSMSLENSKSKMDDEMDSDSSTVNSNSANSPNKPSDNNENRINGEYGLTSSSPSLAAESMESTNCRSPNMSRMTSSSSPLPATTSPVPKTPNGGSETPQLLANSVGVSPGRVPSTNINGSTNCIQTVTTDDLEEVLMELNAFDRQHTKEWKEKVPTMLIPPLLEGYLQFVAKGGNTHFSWNNIKGLFKAKVNQVVTEFYSESPTDELPAVPNVESFDYSNVKEKLFQKLDTFIGIPFTIQRLAELLTSPKRHYRRTDKFLRALEKNMLVVSTVEARVAPPIPDQLSQFPPPHQLPTSLHSPTKSLNHNIFENGPSADSESCKENDNNGPSSRLHGSSSPEINGTGGLSSAHNSNTSPNRSLTALENNSSVLNVSPNQCSNVSSGWNRSPNNERTEKVNTVRKEHSKSSHLEGGYEDEDEDEEEEDEDGDDIELNVDTPSDSNEIQSTSDCSPDRTMNRKNLDNNTHHSISSSVTSKESMDEAQSSLQNESEDRETQKRKREDAPLAADDGSAKKIFLGETVTSASDDDAKEKEASLKESENLDSGLTSNVESSSMDDETNASEDVTTKEGESMKNSDMSPKKGINKNSIDMGENEENRAIDNTLNDAIGVNEIDSSISKSVVLSSAESNVSRDEGDKTKEDAMDVDAECTGSESHIETSSTLI